MPVKFKPSQKIRNKSTGKTETQHFYMKCTSTQELVDYIGSSNAKPKTIVKVKRELTEQEIQIIKLSALHYVENMKRFKTQLSETI